MFPAKTANKYITTWPSKDRFSHKKIPSFFITLNAQPNLSSPLTSPNPIRHHEFTWGVSTALIHDAWHATPEISMENLSIYWFSSFVSVSRRAWLGGRISRLGARWNHSKPCWTPQTPMIYDRLSKAVFFICTWNIDQKANCRNPGYARKRTL